MVDYLQENGIATLWVNNPPVNSLSARVCTNILEGIQKANDDPAVKCIIIAGRNRTFIAGADIREFAEATTFSSKTDVMDCIENSEKPVIAAIENFCMGGGLELAISCHYRVAHSKTRFAFPEVNIGLLPAATGTQKFPRLTSLKFALDIIPSGRIFGAKEALKNKVIDKITDSKVYEASKKFAIEVSNINLDGRRTSKKSVVDADQLQELASAAYSSVAKRYREIAPKFCIKAVAASVKPYVQGMITEAELGFKLFTSNQSMALQHAFFAERSTAKWKLPNGSNWKNTLARPIKTVLILGGGSFTKEIMITLANASIKFLFYEPDERHAFQTFIEFANHLDKEVKNQTVHPIQGRLRKTMYNKAFHLKEASKVDAVIDQFPRGSSLRKEAFQKLDKLCQPSTIFCTLEIEEVASYVSRPKMIVGAHFFKPANRMRLLEVIYGPDSSPGTIASIMNFGRKIGKISVLVKSSTPFVANRLLGVCHDQAVFMLEDGINDQRIIDNCMEDFGLPMGAFPIFDLIGSEPSTNLLKKLLQDKGYTLDENRNMYGSTRYPLFTYELDALGRKGLSTGKGYYTYAEGSRKPIYDESIAEILKNYRKRLGIQPRTFTYQEIFQRCIYSCINESFKILEEGIAHKPQDIDVISIMGFGFPRNTGGLMKYAENTGLQEIYEVICHYNKLYPDQECWKPSKLLEKAAKDYISMENWAPLAKSMSKL